MVEGLVDRDKIVLQPWHIKLRLMKQFVKDLNKEGRCFDNIRGVYDRFTDIFRMGTFIESTYMKL